MAKMLVSKATHVNPVNGMDVSDETVLLFSHTLSEDNDNYYVQSAFPTDNMSARTFPKSEWKLV